MAHRPDPQQVARWMEESQRPTLENVPRYVTTSAPEVIALGRRCGIEPMPYQSHVLNGALGEDELGLWTAGEVVLDEPRQNGKGTIGEERVLGGIGLFHEKLIFWTSHQIPTALEAKKRIEWAIENCDDLRRQVKRIVNVNGQEAIEFYGEDRRTRITDPRRIRFAPRTKHAGRGFAGASTIIYDEAYALTPDQIASSRPTLSTMVNTQVWYLSSPPLDLALAGPKLSREATPGLHLFKLRKRAKAGDRRLAYYGWGMTEDLDELEARDPESGEYIHDLGDRYWWYRINPSLGRLIELQAIEDEYDSMERRVFARERLGAWPVEPIDPSSPEARLINPSIWKNSRVPQLTPGETIVLAIDSAPDRSGLAITAFWIDPEGFECAEVVDFRPGVEWYPGRLKELVQVHNPIAVAIDSRGQASAKLSELRDLGFREPGELPDREPAWGDLWVAQTSDVANATTGAIEAINAGRVRHAGQPELTLAVSSCQLRDIGEGMQAFSRRNSATNVSPLVGWSLGRQAWMERYGTVQRFDPYEAIW